jgi:hypothetical protein
VEMTSGDGRDGEDRGEGGRGGRSMLMLNSSPLPSILKRIEDKF